MRAAELLSIRRNTNAETPAQADVDTYTLPTADSFPDRIPLTPQTDARLEALADGLVLGVVDPRQFVGGLASFYWAAHELEAWAETNRLTARVARLERDCDRLHWLAFNPRKNGADYLAMQTADLWADAVAA